MTVASVLQGEKSTLRSTPLVGIHHRLNARMVPFAGYAMPVQYPTGIVTEHLHTRKAVGLFDVSHMGALQIEGDQATEALERLIPCDLAEMAMGQMRYGVFMLENGGVLDDLLITRQEKGYLLVINASRKDEDLSYLHAYLGREVEIRLWEEPIMMALQGPKAAAVLARFFPHVASLSFMTGACFEKAWISRSGYTGEDGFEILMTGEEGIALTEKLLAEPEVLPVGLGARDSLRLEASLCLYGHELTEQITPIEAGIAWSIGKRRRTEGGFFGAQKVLAQLERGPERRRVGLIFDPGSIVREGAEIQASEGRLIGHITSGGHSPTLGCPIAMGYVESSYAVVGSAVRVQVRGQGRNGKVIKLPFVPHSYFKNK